MGTLAPHDGPQNQQWVIDPGNHCSAADPNYTPDDGIAWVGRCAGNNMIYGHGTLTFLYKGQVAETITGSFIDGLLQPGNVVAAWSDGSKYTGNQLGGLFNGTGKYVSPKGETRDGEWKMGVLNGKASVVWTNGDRYDGEWKNGRQDGHGVETWADGRNFDGEWKDGAPVADTQAHATTSPPAAPAPANATAMAAPVPAAAAVPAVQTTAQATAQPLNLLAPAMATPAPVNTMKTAAEKSGNGVPNPALPLRSHLGTELVAVDGATLELSLTSSGFARTLVLPNGNSQNIAFTFANGPVGTVSEGRTAIGVFRAKPDSLDIDYADGTTETLGEAPGGGLLDRANSAVGSTMCTAWHPQDHVFSQSEKQAAVQEYAARLGVSVGASSGKHRAQDAPACSGGFIASGNPQKSAEDQVAVPAATAVASRDVSRQTQTADVVATPPALPAEAVIAVRMPAIQPIDTPATAPARLEQASFTPPAPASQAPAAAAASNAPASHPGAADCLSVASNGEYWGFQNRCAKSVQFAYCEMSDANPLTSCRHATVSGSVAANGFSALVADKSLTEKNEDHEFRWMACDGGAGEVVPHLDKFDPPAGRCERAVAPAE